MSPVRPPIRIALIGTGAIAQAQHLPAIRALGSDAELVAVADADGRRGAEFAQRHGVAATYTDVNVLLEEQRPDLVHVCTPPSTHADLSISVMRSGAWVYCEKPPCVSLAQLDEIAAVERQTGQWCTFVFQQRFGSGAVHLRRLIGEQSFGRPLLALCDTTWFRDAAYYSVPWRGRWQTEAGGPTLSHGIHALDLLLWLLGAWSEVRAMIGRVDRPIETEDLSMAMVEFQNGARASIVTSVVSPRQETYLRFDFQHATVELRYLYGYTNLDWRLTPRPGLDDQDPVTAWNQFPGETPSSHAAQLAAVVGARLRGVRPPTTTAEVRPTMELITALYRAAITGEPVRSGAIGPSDAFYRQLHGNASAWAPKPGALRGGAA
jgi:predicted dehydrogenase